MTIFTEVSEAKDTISQNVLKCQMASVLIYRQMMNSMEENSCQITKLCVDDGGILNDLEETQFYYRSSR